MTPVLPQPLGPTLFPGTEVRITTAIIDTAAAMVMVVIDPAIIHATTTIIPEAPITVWDLGDTTTAIAPTLGPPDIVITDHTIMALVATLQYQAILITGTTHFIPGDSAECGIHIHPVTALRMALVVAMLHCWVATHPTGAPTTVLPGPTTLAITAVTTAPIVEFGLTDLHCTAVLFFNMAIIPDMDAVIIRSGKQKRENRF